MALHGDEERLLAIEGAGKGFEMEIAGGAFVGGKFCFADVVLRLDEFGAKHGDGFGGGAGGLALVGGSPGAERGRSHGGGVEEGLLQVRRVGLDDHGLAGDERAGSVAGVDGGDAEAADVINQRVAAVVGVDGAQLRLERGGFFQLLLVVRLVEDAGEADHGVGVDESGRNNFGLEDARAGGDFHGGGRADGLNLAVFDQHHAVADGLAGHGVNGLALHGEVFGEGGRGEEADQGDEVRSENFHRASSEVPKQQRWAARGWPAP